MELKKGIEYADKSWNPYSGCRNIEDGMCLVGKACWARGMAHRLRGRFGYDRDDPFKPTFHPDKLDIPLKRKKPTRFDCCFMGDIGFARAEWMEEIFEVIRKCPQHRFYMLTKRPDLVLKLNLKFPPNVWLGVSVNENREVWRIQFLKSIDCEHSWVSFEPLYTAINPPFIDGIDWIVIGAQTNPSIQPNPEWVELLIEEADDLGIPVFIKPNLTVVKGRMELPDDLNWG